MTRNNGRLIRKRFYKRYNRTICECWVKCSPGISFEEIQAVMPCRKAWMISVEGENKQWLCQLHLAEIGKQSPTTTKFALIAWGTLSPILHKK